MLWNQEQGTEQRDILCSNNHSRNPFSSSQHRQLTYTHPLLLLFPTKRSQDWSSDRGLHLKGSDWPDATMTTSVVGTHRDSEAAAQSQISATKQVLNHSFLNTDQRGKDSVSGFSWGDTSAGGCTLKTNKLSSWDRKKDLTHDRGCGVLLEIHGGVKAEQDQSSISVVILGSTASQWLLNHIKIWGLR